MEKIGCFSCLCLQVPERLSGFRPAGPWEDAATAVITEATLVEQPRGKELEYRIIAVNKAGDGEPSNTAMVVL